MLIMVKVLHSRSVLRPNKLIGSFKLDVATVWYQKGGSFYMCNVSVLSFLACLLYVPN